jgi:hypothetical protein
LSEDLAKLKEEAQIEATLEKMAHGELVDGDQISQEQSVENLKHNKSVNVLEVGDKLLSDDTMIETENGLQKLSAIKDAYGEGVNVIRKGNHTYLIQPTVEQEANRGRGVVEANSELLDGTKKTTNGFGEVLDYMGRGNKFVADGLEILGTLYGVDKKISTMSDISRNIGYGLDWAKMYSEASVAGIPNPGAAASMQFSAETAFSTFVCKPASVAVGVGYGTVLGGGLCGGVALAFPASAPFMLSAQPFCATAGSYIVGWGANWMCEKGYVAPLGLKVRDHYNDVGGFMQRNVQEPLNRVMDSVAQKAGGTAYDVMSSLYQGAGYSNPYSTRYPQNLSTTTLSQTPLSLYNNSFIRNASYDLFNEVFPNKSTSFESAERLRRMEEVLQR